MRDFIKGLMEASIESPYARSDSVKSSRAVLVAASIVLAISMISIAGASVTPTFICDPTTQTNCVGVNSINQMSVVVSNAPPVEIGQNSGGFVFPAIGNATFAAPQNAISTSRFLISAGGGKQFHITSFDVA